MFKTYGLIGVLLVVLVELNFFFKIEPFASWYFPLIWIGYILTIDSVVYKLRKNSLLSSRPWQLTGMFIASMLFWWIFEFVNIGVSNWTYSGLEGIATHKNLFGSLSFATVLPALFETVELIMSMQFFRNTTLHREHRVTKKFLYVLMILGAVCFVAPVVLPEFAFPLVWMSFFLFLDPINYLHKQPSIIGYFKRGKFDVPLSLLLAGIILGILWEFWNYWAVPKWTYNIPFLGFFKIFEMPVLGYLGYFPFAFELYAMYWFVRSLFMHKEHILAE